MTSKQALSLEKIKRWIEGLCYSAAYFVKDIRTYEKDSILFVDFTIGRNEKMGITRLFYQDGRVFVKTNGSIWFTTWSGNEKRLSETGINPLNRVVGPYHYPDK